MTAHTVRYHSSSRPRWLRDLNRIKSLRDTIGAFVALAAAVLIAAGAGAIGWLLLHVTQR
jgi:hypothetical protein